MKINLPRIRSAEIKMTPMIDIIFLLLIFFVCTANFSPPEETLPTDMNLPGNVAAEIVIPDPVSIDTVHIQITFDQTPAWQIEGNYCQSLDEVQAVLQRIRNIKTDIPVILKSAENVPMANVIDVYDICRKIGLANIQFSAD